MAGRRRQAAALFWWLVFLCYSGVMLWLLFGQRLGSSVYSQQLAEGMNLKPFDTLERYWRLLQSDNADLVRHAFVNLAGNVVMFIPLGFLLPRVYPRLRKFFKTLLCAVILIAAVEAVQYFTMLGTCDVDDLILNISGVILGYWLYRLF